MRLRSTAIAIGLGLCMAAACTGVEQAAEGHKAKGPGAAFSGGDSNRIDAQGDSFTYQAAGKRDPFHSYLAEVAEQAKQERAHRKVEPTELFDLEQYRLIGLITGTSQPKAMVEDPNGRGHVVHSGSRLGRNGGRVRAIDSTSIEVIEVTRDGTGKEVEIPITIKLPPSEFGDIVQD